MNIQVSDISNISSTELAAQYSQCLSLTSIALMVTAIIQQQQSQSVCCVFTAESPHHRAACTHCLPACNQSIYFTLSNTILSLSTGLCNIQSLLLFPL